MRTPTDVAGRYQLQRVQNAPLPAFRGGDAHRAALGSGSAHCGRATDRHGVRGRCAGRNGRPAL